MPLFYGISKSIMNFNMITKANKKFDIDLKYGQIREDQISAMFKDKKIEVIFPMLVGDFLKIMLGLALSVAVVSGVIYFDSM